MTRRLPWWREWIKPGAIIGALALLNAIGWSMYGMSVRTKDDVETRLREVERKVNNFEGRFQGMPR